MLFYIAISQHTIEGNPEVAHPLTNLQLMSNLVMNHNFNPWDSQPTKHNKKYPLAVIYMHLSNRGLFPVWSCVLRNACSSQNLMGNLSEIGISLTRAISSASKKKFSASCFLHEHFSARLPWEAGKSFRKVFLRDRSIFPQGFPQATT